MKPQGTTAMLNRCTSALPDWGLATFPAELTPKHFPILETIRALCYVKTLDGSFGSWKKKKKSLLEV